jgi:hypothetical protein
MRGNEKKFAFKAMDSFSNISVAISLSRSKENGIVSFAISGIYLRGPQYTSWIRELFVLFIFD